MKIVHIIPTLGIGGAEKFVISLCNELAKEQTNEVIICSLYSFSNNEHAKLTGLVNGLVRVVSLGKKRGFDFLIFIKLFRLLKKLKPDIVNSHLGSIYYIFPSLFFFSQIKFFHTIHTLPEKEDSAALLTIIKRFFIKRKSLEIITLSLLNAQNAIKVFDLKEVKYIENGIDDYQMSNKFNAIKSEISALKYNEKTKILTHVGRINPIKNQKLLINVFRRLELEKENVILIFLGYASPDQKELEKSIFENCPDRVKYLGAKSNIRDYLVLSDGFCLTSHYEGFPITLLEALSVGAIPLCVPVGGIPDIVDHSINGFLSKNSSEEDYYNLLKNFQKLSAEEINIIKRQCINSFKNKYDIITCAENYANFYREKLGLKCMETTY